MARMRRRPGQRDAEMCLIVLAWQCLPDHPLVVGANRDEVIARPAAPAAPWPDTPAVLAGRDLLAGGTWLGATPAGRFAAITNFHAPDRGPGARSRGELPLAFLAGTQSPRAFVQALSARAQDYGPFTLLVGDADTLWCYGNRNGDPQAVVAGVHVLGNATLDAPGEVRADHARGRFSALLGAGPPDVPGLLALLGDRAPAPAGGPWSAMRLEHGAYGTRCSTVITRHRGGAITFAEHTHLPAPAGVVHYHSDPMEMEWKASGAPA